MNENTAEAMAHAVLRIVGERPGQVGRLRCVRIVLGLSISVNDGEEDIWAQYDSGIRGWTLREGVSLIDALIDGGLVTQTIGQRPTLCLTRAGHRALDALEVAR